MKKLLLFVLTVCCLPVVAGLYGVLHDQISYTISPEYFTKFKYDQFGFEPQRFGGDRSTVAVIGFLATWWVGAFCGLFLGGTALFQADARSMRGAIMRGVPITLSIAAICALLGLGYGWFFIRKLPNGWYLPAEVLDAHAFLSVGSMHNCSYGGGTLGLIIAITDMEWRRMSKRAKVQCVHPSPSMDLPSLRERTRLG